MKKTGVYLLEQTGAKPPGLKDKLGENMSRTKGFYGLTEKFSHAKMSIKESLCLCHLFFFFTYMLKFLC